ncbi:MAG TPA: glycoside hydrolase family 19 protein [Polyangiaceae bacterium]|nr:glycoside hydrolase family 19 protein [Polyangiaceae bacterium]
MKALRSACRASLVFVSLALLGACGARGGDEPTSELNSSLDTSCTPAAYVAGTAYIAGARVANGGSVYECKPYPYTGWCSIGGPYAPGSGADWQDAWTLVTSCDAASSAPPPTSNPPLSSPPPSNPPPSSPPAGGSSSSSCNFPVWQAGQNYVTGNQVIYSANGNAYIATHDNPGYDPTISTWFWSPTACTGGTSSGTSTGGASTGGSAATGFAAIVSEATFDSMFPNRNGFYTYQGLVSAIGSYPAFASTGSTVTQKQEAAAFLANVAHETGGLVYVEEIQKDVYCQPSASCPCAAGQEYYGRGPIQLSWNYNYCAAGAALGLSLQSNPGLVSSNSTVAWQTGLWFWMTQTGGGSMTAHNAIVSGAGFGETIRTINGGLECNGANPSEMQSRINYYTQFCQMLGVSPGSATSC